MTKTKRAPKAAGKGKRAPGKPRRISLGGYQFARVEGRFARFQAALAFLYPSQNEPPMRLYPEEARKLAAFLEAFADWADAQAARRKGKAR